MGVRHKHADVIIAWANGEDVEWYDPLNARWYPIIATDKALVCWGMTDYEYRVKPKTVKKEGWVARYRDGSTGGSIYPTRAESQQVYAHAVDHHRIEWEEEV